MHIHYLIASLSLVALTACEGGDTTGFGYPGGWISSLDSQHVYQDANAARSFSAVTSLPDGSVVAGGRENQIEPVYLKTLLVRLRPDGTTMWRRTFADGEVYGLASSEDGLRIYAVGDGYDGENHPGWIACIGPDGVAKWEAALGHLGPRVRFLSVAPLPDGGAIAGGWSKLGTGEPAHAILVRVDAAGKVLWHQDRVGEGWERVLRRANGDLIAVGPTDPWLLRFREDGTEIAGDPLPPAPEAISSIVEQSDGALVVAGTIAGEGAGWVARLGDGGFDWQLKLRPGELPVKLSQIARTKDDEILVVGRAELNTTADGEPWFAGWVAKVSPAGTVVWQKTILGREGWLSWLSAIVATPQNIYAVGQASPPIRWEGLRAVPR